MRQHNRERRAEGLPAVVLCGCSLIISTPKIVEHRLWNGSWRCFSLSQEKRRASGAARGSHCSCTGDCAPHTLPLRTLRGSHLNKCGQDPYATRCSHHTHASMPSMFHIHASMHTPMLRSKAPRRYACATWLLGGCSRVAWPPGGCSMQYGSMAAGWLQQGSLAARWLQHAVW